MHVYFCWGCKIDIDTLLKDDWTYQQILNHYHLPITDALLDENIKDKYVRVWDMLYNVIDGHDCLFDCEYVLVSENQGCFRKYDDSRIVQAFEEDHFYLTRPKWVFETLSNFEPSKKKINHFINDVKKLGLWQENSFDRYSFFN